MVVITDTIVKGKIEDFSNGYVKRPTPHDHNDFNCGQHHKLAFINVLGEDSPNSRASSPASSTSCSSSTSLNDVVPQLKGEPHIETCKTVAVALKQKGLWAPSAGYSAESPAPKATADLSKFYGPPHQPNLLRWLDHPLGSGSTAEVFEYECCCSVQCEKQPAPSAENGWFQSYACIEAGEHVAVKCFAYTEDCIGSFSAGPQPSNYPTKFATSVKEQTVGARLAVGDGPGKDHVLCLLASWLDKQGHWLVYKLVTDGIDLCDVLAPTSSKRDALCARPLVQAAALFKQFVLGLDYISRQGVIHRDGGLSNWMITGVETSEPNVVLIDYGLSLCSDTPFTEPDSATHLLGHLCACEDGFGIDAALSVTGGEDLDKDRLNPIDWCYAPGAAGPKFPPPPEVRVLREELPGSAADELIKEQLPYSSGYDVWVLGWAWMQIVLGERWEDWKSGESDDPLIQLVRSHFYDKKKQVEVPWELGRKPRAWRLEILSAGPERFQKGFLNEFLSQASQRILSRGLEKATPLQIAFVKPEGRLRSILLKMIDFDPAHREHYLRSGALLRDVEALAREDV